jgi:hypothetical protein
MSFAVRIKKNKTCPVLNPIDINSTQTATT